MSLSDLFRGEASTLLTEAGLLLFVAVFVAVVWRVAVRMPRAESRALGRMALEDAPVAEGARKGGAS